jgi:hypothetical protein
MVDIKLRFSAPCFQEWDSAAAGIRLDSFLSVTSQSGGVLYGICPCIVLFMI